MLEIILFFYLIFIVNDLFNVNLQYIQYYILYLRA